MKTSGGWVTIIAVAALALQGCAGTGSLTYADGAAPSSGRSGSGDGAKAVVRADNKADFEAVVAAIHKQMEPGGRWQYTSSSERATIDGSFADMQALYDKFGSVDKMDQNAKVRLLADQSTVNAILTKKDGDRLICSSVIPVGSHLPVQTCRTYTQIQAEQREAQRSLMEMNRRSNQQKAGGN
ncbi:MAG TPA: hypothetical protein VFY97_11980 [Rhodanobacteraceae bacterium]|nr:hypothetical protein [Rhodanobacteraceae bacterium]